MKRYAIKATLIILFITLQASAFSYAVAQQEFSIENTSLQIYRDGLAAITQTVNVEETHPYIIHHRTINKNFLSIEKQILQQYPLDELKEAIDNYDKVMGEAPDTYFGWYKHGFTDFFRHGVNKDPPFMKFLSEREPLKNLKKNT